eukprot:scaffold1159_cov215-Pinguiococcus_pyrenoidosus.AAC.3
MGSSWAAYHMHRSWWAAELFPRRTSSSSSTTACGQGWASEVRDGAVKAPDSPCGNLSRRQLQDMVDIGGWTAAWTPKELIMRQENKMAWRFIRSSLVGGQAAHCAYSLRGLGPHSACFSLAAGLAVAAILGR